MALTMQIEVPRGILIDVLGHARVARNAIPEGTLAWFHVARDIRTDFETASIGIAYDLRMTSPTTPTLLIKASEVHALLLYMIRLGVVGREHVKSCGSGSFDNRGTPYRHWEESRKGVTNLLVDLFFDHLEALRREPPILTFGDVPERDDI